MRLLLTATLLFALTGEIGLAAGFYPPPWGSAARGTRADSDAADSDIDQLESWSAVYRAFKLYRQCDDASIAEGYDDKIVQLLTQQWPTVSALAKLTQSDPLFEQFVLRHIDTLMSPE